MFCYLCTEPQGRHVLIQSFMHYAKNSLPPFPHYSPFFRRFSSRAKIARVEAFMGLGVFFAAVADRKKPDEKYRKVLCRSIRYSLITRSLVN